MRIGPCKGGGGFDIAMYGSAASGIVASIASSGENTGGAAGDTYDSIEGLYGSAFNDRLIGNGAANVLLGADGNDILVGNGGTDTLNGGEGLRDYASYAASLTAIFASLTDPTDNTGDAAGDAYIAVEGLIGGAFDDTLVGDQATNFLQGGLGADALDGGGGLDWADYGNASSGLTANLASPAANSGEAAGDVFTSIENIRGSAFDDILIGDAGSNTLRGEDGADTLVGGEGTDFAQYRGSSTGLNVSLADPNANSGQAVGDVYVSIEGLIGSDFNDTLSGDGAGNVLLGGIGVDTLIGGAGSDTLDGGAGADFMLGGEGDDTFQVDDTFDLVDEGVVFSGYGFGGFDTIVSTANWFWDVYSIGERMVIAEGANDAAGAGTTIVGSIWSNELVGNSKTNIMFGRGGADTYRAGDGIDFISLSLLGLTDENAYDGVNGANTIVVDQRASGPTSYDILFEFESGKDKVDVSDYGYAGVNDVLARGHDDGAGNSYFALGDGLDYVYFVGLTKAQIAADDFII